MLDDRSGRRPGFDAFRDALLRRRDALPRRLAQVADYAIASPDEIAFGTAASVASGAGVQPSTLVRFGQAFGYAGFSDLQAAFRERLRDRVTSYDERLRALQAPGGAVPPAAVLLDGAVEASMRSLATLRAAADGDALERAATLLDRAATLYLVGQRRSYPATAAASYLLGKLRIRHVLIGSALGTDAETIGCATPSDAAVVVSFTPYAPATVALAAALARDLVPSVLITDSPFSPLAAAPGGVRFEVAEADFEGFRPLAATMALLTALVLAVAERRVGVRGAPAARP